MTNLEKLRASNAWDARYDLPTIPIHNNCHLYIAYAARLLGPDSVLLEEAYGKFLAQCEVTSGYITRWPGGDRSSHDELMGAAYLNAHFAGRALDFLNRSDGYWSNAALIEERDNVKRFVFLIPFLKARAGFRVGTLSQLQFAAHVLYSAFFVEKGQTSGLLKVWLMSPAMEKYPICKVALGIWKHRWLKRGFNPRTIFTSHYLDEVPVLKELAREDWE